MGIITFLTLVVLSPILANTYGVHGLIVAYLIASTAGTAYGSYKARRKFNAEFSSSSLARIYIISAIAALPPILLTIYFPLQSILTLVIGSLIYLFVYVTLFPIARIITNTEMQNMGAVLRKIRFAGPLVTLFIRYQQMLKRKLGIEMIILLFHQPYSNLSQKIVDV